MCISGDASRGQTARLRPVRQSPFPGPRPRSRCSPSRALWLPCVQSVSSVFHSCVSPHHPAGSVGWVHNGHLQDGTVGPAWGPAGRPR